MKKPSSKPPISESDRIDTHGHSDGRGRWQWQSRYHKVAKKLIFREALIAVSYLLFFLIMTGIFAGLQTRKFAIDVSYVFGKDNILVINADLLLAFFIGGLGGTTFSIKWLMHAVGTGRWHLDRFYWRLFVPLVGCIYAVIVLELLKGGFVKGIAPSDGSPVVLAFLIGYFSDGVSGLLTNIANAIFGTIEKK